MEDGWELVSFEFGKLYNGNIATNLDHPKFILYNKRTGILRVFYYLREANFNLPYDLVTLKLEFDHNDNISQYEPSLFSHFEEIAQPLSTHNKGLSEESSNKLNNGQSPNNPCSGMWVYADFTMAYDACVCNYKYKRMKISVKVIDKAKITLTGDLNSNPIDKPLGSIGTADLLSKYKTNFKTVAGAAKTAKTQYKTTSAYTNDVATKFGKKLPKEKELEILDDLGSLAQGIPYLGAAIGVVNFLVSQDEEPSKPSNPPITFNASVNIKGDIEQFGTVESKRLGVPGSIHTNMPDQDIPLYNEPLGVLTLLESPLIEYTSHVAGMRTQSNFLVPHTFHRGLPIVRNYKFKEDIKLALNPSSELIIEDIKVSVVLEYSHSNYSATKAHHNSINAGTVPKYFNYPYTPGANFIFNKPLGIGAFGAAQPFGHDMWESLSNSPMNLELSQRDSLYKISLGQMPIQCFENTSLTLISSGASSRPEDEAKLALRINATLIHPNNPTRKYHVLHSYALDPTKFIEIQIQEEQLYEIFQDEGETENSSNFTLGSTLNWGNTSTKVFGSSKHIPDFLIFQDEHIGPGEHRAWDGIIIRDNVTIASGTSFLAGKYIKVRSDNKISPEISMKIGLHPSLQGCSASSPENFIVSDIGTFCDNNNIGSYQAYAPKRTIINSQESTKANSFNLYPNPTDNLVNVQVELVDGAIYNITVIDLSGRVIYTRNLTSQEFENSTININTSSFESGIYFVNVTEGANRMTKRLVITR